MLHVYLYKTTRTCADMYNYAESSLVKISGTYCQDIKYGKGIWKHCRDAYQQSHTSSFFLHNSCSPPELDSFQALHVPCNR